MPRWWRRRDRRTDGGGHTTKPPAKSADTAHPRTRRWPRLGRGVVRIAERGPSLPEPAPSEGLRVTSVDRANTALEDDFPAPTGSDRRTAVSTGRRAASGGGPASSDDRSSGSNGRAGVGTSVPTDPTRTDQSTREDAAEPGADDVADGEATAAHRDHAAADSELNRRLDDLEQRLADLDVRLTGIADRLDASSAQGQATVARVASLQERAESVEAVQVGASQRLAGLEGRIDAAETRAQSVQTHAETSGERMTATDRLIESLTDRLAALTQHVSDHDRSLTQITSTIAVEVERHTTDALLEAQHNVQLTVNSIAQLALAVSESSRAVTEDLPAESARALLESFRVDLDAILAQLGFVPLETQVGQAFDPNRHRALKRVRTSEPKQDKVIARVIRDGYRSSATGRILLFADVEVSRHR